MAGDTAKKRHEHDWKRYKAHRMMECNRGINKRKSPDMSHFHHDPRDLFPGLYSKREEKENG